MKRRRVFLCGIVFVLNAGVDADGAVARAITLEAARREVGTYERLDLLVDVGREYPNPFDPCEVTLDVLIEGPDGSCVSLAAFYCQPYEREDIDRGGKVVAWYYPVGPGAWKARFAPTTAGEYTARASLRDRLGQTLSAPIAFRCRRSDSKGFVCTSRDDPRFLAFTEGEPFFVIGQNVAFVGESQYVNVPKAEQIFAALAGHGANFVRIWTCCKDWALAIEASKSAWTRSWNRSSPVVPLPGSEGGSNATRCVRLEGDHGAAIVVSPSHPVAVRPMTRYVFSGRFRAEGCQAVRLQVGEEHWDVPVRASGDSDSQSFRKEFTTDMGARWLGRVSFHLVGPGTLWLLDLSLREADDSPELLWEADVNRPVRGYYNPLDCFMLDQLVEAAERNGIYLMLCLITRDRYMDDLSKVDSPEYARATDDAKKLMRYAVARWGYSTSVAAWEYFNEMDPGKPTDEFYRQVGEYLEQIDLYGHLRTTSTWHPSARDCRHRQLDIAQGHHYMRPGENDFKDEVQSIIEQTQFLRQHAPNKPALIGEFGLATAQWGLSDYMKQDTEGIHFHNCLWASAFAGSSGTAMFWWWDQLDRQGAYRHYAPLSRYLEGVSWAGCGPIDAAVSDKRIRLLGYQRDGGAYLWLRNEQASWWNVVAEQRRPDEIQGAAVTVRGLPRGRYSVEWWDTRSGTVAETQEVEVSRDVLRARIPTFRHDTACKMTRR